MTEKDVKILKKLKFAQVRIAEQIEHLKQNAPEEIVEQLETAERGAWNAVIEIDAVANRINKPLADEIERDKILSRMKIEPKHPRRKIGGILV